MMISDLITVMDAGELEWEGGKGWTNGYGQRTHQNAGSCEIDDIALCFQRLPRIMKDEPARYVYYIEQIVDLDRVDVIVGPAFATSETEAKMKLLDAVKRLLIGPELIAA